MKEFVKIANLKEYVIVFFTVVFLIFIWFRKLFSFLFFGLNLEKNNLGKERKKINHE